MNKVKIFKENAFDGALFTSIIIFVSYFIGLLIISPGITVTKGSIGDFLNCKSSTWNTKKVNLKSEGQDCPSIVEMVVNFDELQNDNSSRLVGNLRIWPAGEFGQSGVSSGVAQRKLLVNFESTDVSEWKVEAKRFIGSRTIQIPLKNDNAIYKYPLDNYKGSWSVYLADWQSGEPLPIAITVINKPIYGWNLSLSQKPVNNELNLQKVVNLNGEAHLDWIGSRSSSTKLSVLILISIILLGIYATSKLTIAIATGKRPPTLGALGWLATTLFALIEIRSRFPGSPPLGIALDLFITYPAALSILCFILIQTLAWVKRDDWDMKNTPE